MPNITPVCRILASAVELTTAMMTSAHGIAAHAMSVLFDRIAGLPYMVASTIFAKDEHRLRRTLAPGCQLRKFCTKRIMRTVGRDCK